MKKTNNKGFSLVELIIVIAIMAILAGAIAPALIRYIDKSRKSNDTSSADTIETALNTAMGNETISEFASSSSDGILIKFVPTKQLQSDLVSSDKLDEAIAISYKADANWKSSMGRTQAEAKSVLQEELALTLGEKVPKLKYQKDAGVGKKVDGVSFAFYGYISPSGAVEVYIASDKLGLSDVAKFYDAKNPKVVNDKTNHIYEVCPEVCESYQ